MRVINSRYKVGIKFCGGCQAKYNRRETYEKIVREFPDVTFEFVTEKGEYDLVVVIEGCHIKCADTSPYRSRNGFIHVDSPDITDTLFEINQYLTS